MSLIMEALKKAQQLRLRESKGTPLPTHAPKSQKSLRNLGKWWIVIGLGLVIVVLLSFHIGEFLSPPSPSIPIRNAVHVEKKTLVPMLEKKIFEPSKDMRSPPKEVQNLPKDNLSLAKANLNIPKDILSLLKDVLSPPKWEKPVGTLSSLKEEEIPIKKIPMEKKVTASVPALKSATEKSFLPIPRIPPAPMEEKKPGEWIEVKREGDRDHPFASEVIAYFNLGVQFYNEGEFPKAIQSYQKVIELDPAYVEAYNNLGIIYQESGDFDRAFEAFRKSIEINPRYEKGYNNLGILLYLRGRHEQAIETFQKALAINSNNIESYINLGVLFKKQGQLGRAIESYQKALNINPRLKEIHYNVALLYDQLENFNLAIGYYKQFINLSSASQSDLVSKVQMRVDELEKEMKKKK